ncbi:hypothetical protein [Sphingobium lignivorans]|uniref:Methyltransferase n=1 Tax=Sphingobium lignivorans TaxID=2735886 RepID=A0ABR6NJV7_9SPHN|nr:hypothetical protein [Sphingobium lignivorans]MBB5987396.1 hypothetical protein [Sphingobium lignivorans]
MRGDISTGRAKNRHPLDWYVEQGWEWDQIVREIGLAPELEPDCHVWDPACGYGHSGQRLEAYGLGGRIILSDLVQNVEWDEFETAPRFFAADFLVLDRAPAPRCSIWTNPPYSYRAGILEAFVRQAMRLATDRVVMLVAHKWLAPGKNRSPLFRQDFPPELVLIFSQRPSMPPGDRLHALGNRAYRGGVIDYAAVVWDVRCPTKPGDTRTVWLPPLGRTR